MRSYGKVYSSFWGWASRKRLSPGARELALYLLTNPHANGTGCYYLPDGYIIADLSINGTPNGWGNGSANPFEVVAELFTELEKTGFVHRCPATQWVLVPKMIDYDPPANSNVGKSLAKELHHVPTDFSYRTELAQVLSPYADRIPSEALNGLSNGSSNGSSNGMTTPDLSCPDLSCPVGGDEKSPEYAFEGSIIKINPSQAKKWQEAYPWVNLIPELTAADAYYVDNPPKNGKWFFAASNWLKRANEEKSPKTVNVPTPGRMTAAAVAELEEGFFE